MQNQIDKISNDYSIDKTKYSEFVSYYKVLSSLDWTQYQNNTVGLNNMRQQLKTETAKFSPVIANKISDAEYDSYLLGYVNVETTLSNTLEQMKNKINVPVGKVSRNKNNVSFNDYIYDNGRYEYKDFIKNNRLDNKYIEYITNQNKDSITTGDLSLLETRYTLNNANNANFKDYIGLTSRYSTRYNDGGKSRFDLDMNSENFENVKRYFEINNYSDYVNTGESSLEYEPNEFLKDSVKMVLPLVKNNQTNTKEYFNPYSFISAFATNSNPLLSEDSDNYIKYKNNINKLIDTYNRIDTSVDNNNSMVDVTAIKDQMIKNNQKINWVPDDIKNWRMWKWLEWAKDWNISRNRYWWSAIPVWQNEDKTEEICIWSIKELYELNKDFWQIEFKDGKYFYTNTWKEIDLHKHFVDEILIKNPKTWNTLKRIPEVLDCWFESGSMPYASKHYMWQELEKNSDCLVSKDGTFKFPADFIAEWLDQTRGWFYTLLILWTALFDETPFKNCIVNGIVLAEDWKKMSKSLQNYPAPELIFDKYWADAMRFYLLNSPVVEAQDFRFSEAWVEEVVKKVILPLWNTYYFFTTYANIDNFEPKWLTKTENILDKWLLSELNELTLEVTNAFEKYKLNEATRPIVKFMDNLTNWYIRRSRKRFWKSENDWDKLQAYETLYFALVELTKILAPFMPFVSENIFKNLTWKESVHLEDFPIYNKNLIDLELNETTDKVQKIINLWLAWRANQKIRVRQPLQSITITQSFEKYYNEIIKEELNVKEVLVVDGSSLAKRICKPNWRNIWPKFGKDVKFIMSEAKAGNFTELPNGNVKVWDFELEVGDFELVYESSDANAKIESGFGMVITMDDKITEELKQEWFARDIVRHIQEARKECNYNVDDRIFIKIESNELAETIANFANYIETETLSKIDNSINSPDLEKDISIEEIKIKLSLKK